MASSGDVLRALAEESLARGVHPDRERVLRDYIGEDDEQNGAPSGEGQGPGGEAKPRTEADAKDADAAEGSGGDQEDDDARGAGKPGSPTTAPESGRQKGRSGR